MVIQVAYQIVVHQNHHQVRQNVVHQMLVLNYQVFQIVVHQVLKVIQMVHLVPVHCMQVLLNLEVVEIQHYLHFEVDQDLELMNPMVLVMHCTVEYLILVVDLGNHLVVQLQLVILVPLVEKLDHQMNLG